MMNAQDTAHWFLSKDSMTHKKLQKLCYYAQAWYCALYEGNPLFPEEIQAWVHGPVIPALRFSYMDYRWNLIPVYEGSLPEITAEVREVLEAVHRIYGDISGEQLEQLTRSELPWQLARADCQPWEASRNVIPVSSLCSFYQHLYDQGQTC